MKSVRIIGPGRAGLSFARGLAAAGWSVASVLDRGADVSTAAEGVDLLIVATPDSAIAEVALEVVPVSTSVVAHLSGTSGLDVLAPHPRRAAIHPLRSLPAPGTPLAGAWFAVTGDPLGGEVVGDLGGRLVEVDDQHRAEYHAAATIAANHLVALLGQVERVAAKAGVPLEAYFDLVRSTVDNVARLGPADALTGPVARGDWDTVAAHLAVLDDDERSAYEAMAELARRLVTDRLRVVQSEAV